MYGFLMAIDAALLALAVVGHVVEVLRPRYPRRGIIAPEIGFSVAEETKPRIGVTQDTSGELRLSEEDMAICTAHGAMRPRLEVGRDRAVAVVALEDGRMLGWSLKRSIRPTRVAVAATVDQRVQSRQA
jgi:hypothetical protein